MGVSRSVRLVLKPHHKDSHTHVSRGMADCTSGASEFQNEGSVPIRGGGSPPTSW